MTLSCRPILLARVALILLVGTLSLAGCQESRDPHSYLGMTVADAKREFPNDGAVVYGRRGTSSPDFFTGQILLSPYAIRQPLRERDIASHVTCRVDMGTIVDCTFEHVEKPNGELLQWFQGRRLSSLPLEFYVESPDDVVTGWVDLDSYKKPLEQFDGVILFHGPKHLYFLRFFKGKCVGVDIEGDW